MAEDSIKTDGLREVPAKEILEKIKRGVPVEYHNTIIKGILDAKNLDLPKESVERGEIAKFFKTPDSNNVIHSTFIIIDSQINEDIIFENIMFKSQVNFKGTKFKGNATFAGSSFVNGAIFEDAQFCKSIDCSYSLFKRPIPQKGGRLKIGYAQSEEFKEACFKGCQFKRDAIFVESIFGPADFDQSVFGGYANFGFAIFHGYASFWNSYFEGETEFVGSEFEGFVCFENSHFLKSITFAGSRFNEPVRFNSSKFDQIAGFHACRFEEDALFTECRFGKEIHIERSEFNGETLTFRNAVFNNPQFQEETCRKAKIVLEKNGNREEAGYHFYREMAAIRARKGILSSKDDFILIDKSRYRMTENFSIIKRIIWYDFLEYFFIQKIFGYGVHPWRCILAWGILVIAFAIIYSAGNGIVESIQPFDYLKFSFATAIAPGYIASIITPNSVGYKLLPEFQAIAMVETILGTIMWAAFIATFARRYMR